MSKRDSALEQSMSRRRPPESISEEVASTVFGDMALSGKAAEDLDTAAIADSRFQSRVRLDLDHVEVLMGQIQTEGLLTPILVRPMPGQAGKYELVAGHHRLEAYRRLKIERIPAIVKRLSDAEAIRALTAENTVRKDLSDWELYKSIVALREHNAVKNVTELAGVMNCSRAQIYNLEAFSVLPASIQKMLDETPTLMGASLAYAVKPLLVDGEKAQRASNLLEEALRLLKEDKLKQAGILGWVQRKLTAAEPSRAREYSYKEDGQTVKLVLSATGAKISGDFDETKLHQLIQENIHRIRKT